MRLLHNVAVDGPRRHRVRYEIPGHARLLTCSTSNRAAVFDRPWAADLFAEHLEAARSTMAFRLIAWVLMPEHFHLLVIPDVERCPVPMVLHAIKEPVSRRVLPRARREDPALLPRLTGTDGIARLWLRGGGHDRNITHMESLVEAARYIHANPVKRALCRRPEQWPWSSARWYAGDRTGPVRVDPWR